MHNSFEVGVRGLDSLSLLQILGCQTVSAWVLCVSVSLLFNDPSFQGSGLVFGFTGFEGAEKAEKAERAEGDKSTTWAERTVLEFD